MTHRNITTMVFFTPQRNLAWSDKVTDLICNAKLYEMPLVTTTTQITEAKLGGTVDIETPDWEASTLIDEATITWTVPSEFQTSEDPYKIVKAHRKLINEDASYISMLGTLCAQSYD